MGMGLECSASLSPTLPVMQVSLTMHFACVVYTLVSVCVYGGGGGGGGGGEVCALGSLCSMI